MNPFIENLKHFWFRLSPRQRISITAVLVGSLAVLIAIAYWANRPNYVLLFGNLNPESASRIVDSLKKENIPYKLKDGGTSIYVPEKHVYELRLRFASQGLVDDGTTGYELFDQPTLGGMTDFMQRLNLKRALEGELARTITSIEQVEHSRVHLVLPQRSVFQQTSFPASASVVVQLRKGKTLSIAQIQGITSLVAGAVEGLDPANVTIVDTRGNMLSDPDAYREDVNLSSHQLKFQRELETHLTEKAQSMLDRVLGAKNALVRVAATLDFTQRVSEKELIDPESATVVSEEQLNQENGANSSLVRNYELSRTRERSEQATGEIKYLTVSVILNQRYTYPQDGGDPVPNPYTEEELREIESLVQNAVGFNPERGDRITIFQSQFEKSPEEELIREVQREQQYRMYMQYLRYFLLILAIAGAIWLIRSATRKVAPPAPIDGGILQPASSTAAPSMLAGGEDAEVPLLEGDDEELLELDENDLFLLDDVYSSKLSSEAKARLKENRVIYQKIKQTLEENPEESAAIIRSWLMEAPGKQLEKELAHEPYG